MRSTASSWMSVLLSLWAANLIGPAAADVAPGRTVKLSRRTSTVAFGALFVLYDFSPAGPTVTSMSVVGPPGA